MPARLRSLRFWVPAAIALAGTILFLTSHSLDERSIESILSRRARANMQALARGTARIVSDFAADGNVHAALRVVGYNSASPLIDDAFLSDDLGRPLARGPGDLDRVATGRPLGGSDVDVRSLLGMASPESARVLVTHDRSVLACAPVRWRVPTRTPLFFVVRSSYAGAVLAAESQMRFKTAVSLLTGVLLMLALAGVLHVRVTRPAMRLSAAAARLAAGDRSARTGLTGRDELGIAGASFDRMADSIARAEDELHRLRHQLDALLQHMPVGIVAVEPKERRVLFHNRVFDELYGARLELGQSLDDLLPRVRLERADGSEYPRDELSIHRVTRTGQPADVNDMVYVHADGTRVPVFVRAVPIRREGSGELDTVLVMAQDRRELERAFEERRETQRLFDVVLRTLPVGVVVIARDTFRMLYANPKWLEIYGTTVAPGTDMAEQLGTLRNEHPDGRPFPADQLGAPQVLRTGLPAEVRDIVHVRPDGGRVPILISAVPAQLGPGPEFDAVVSVVQDRRELKDLLDELRDWERRYEKVVAATGQVVYEWDLVNDLEVVSANRVIAMGPESPRDGRSIKERWAERVHPDDRERALKALDRSLTDGQPYDCEYRYRHSDDRWVALHDRGFLEKDTAGRAVRMFGTMTDVTDRHLLEQQLRQAQKMETVGTLAGGIAHDFNNQLTAVLGHLDLLASDMPPGDPGQAHVRVARLAAERCTQLTRGLLAFSRQIESRLRPLGLDPLVEETLQILRRVLPGGMEVKTALHSAGTAVLVDAVQMQQVLFNLCLNARDAMPAGGTLTIASRRATVDSVVRRPADASLGEFVELSVSDTGTGIAPEVLPRVFEPFFTTKPVGKGTGLGLAMVYGIVHKHGGWIELESTLERGTTFRLYLPLAAEPTAGGERPRAERGGWNGSGELVLVVDDEPAVRELAALTLEEHGYRAIAAADGSEALRLLREHRRDVRAVVLDLVMPGLSAASVLRELRALAPGVPVILSSGFPPPAQDLHLAVEALLPKPYPAADLVRIVGDLLRGTPEGASRA